MIHESFGRQVGFQPVTSVVVFCPLIFQACLSYIDCLAVLDRDELGSFHTEKFVCLSVWSAEVMQPCVCLLGQSGPLTDDSGEENGCWKTYLLLAFSSVWSSSGEDHQALHPDSQIRRLESLRTTWCCCYFDRKQPSRETQATINIWAPKSFMEFVVKGFTAAWEVMHQCQRA